uniref:Uncharacterized protein n=1 Tax=Anguilla anguilla TaxID=7936 RepID=A0A0E9S6U7_ANGAN
MLSAYKMCFSSSRCKKPVSCFETFTQKSMQLVQTVLFVDPI